MSESSGQCELCLNQSNEISIRVFPCLYHCKKMLCIQHLSEHDKYIEKQITSQKELEILWKNYMNIFNEEKLVNQLEELKFKLEYYRELKQEMNNLLLIDHFQDSIENNQKFQKAIQVIQKAIQHENQKFDNINLKIETDSNDDEEEEEEEEHQPNMDYSSFSSSISTNHDCPTVDSLPSMLNPNGDSSLEDNYLQHNDESDDHGNSIKMENDEHSFKDASSTTPSRKITASRIRGCCPLTHDGAFGIDSRVHGVRLCSSHSSRTYRLNEHLRRVHHLTPFASLAISRAVGSGQDPLTTRLFSNQHVILNFEELRTVTCPITKPFINHPLLSIENSPCDAIKQVRHLKEHLRRVHKFTNIASNSIIKAVKTNKPVDQITFPQWFEILEHDNQI